MIRSLAPLIAFLSLVAFAPCGQTAPVNDRGDAEVSRIAQFVSSTTRDLSFESRPDLTMLFVRVNFVRATELAEILYKLTGPNGLRATRKTHFIALERGHFVAIVADADTLPLVLKIIAELDQPGPFVDPSCASSREYHPAPNTKPNTKQP